MSPALASRDRNLAGVEPAITIGGGNQHHDQLLTHYSARPTIQGGKPLALDCDTSSSVRMFVDFMRGMGLV